MYEYRQKYEIDLAYDRIGLVIRQNSQIGYLSRPLIDTSTSYL